MDIQYLVKDGLTHNRVRELYLYQIPILKTVNDWDSVKEIGKVSFQGKRATYNGGLIYYKSKIYFIQQHTITALSPYRKWAFTTKVEIVSEKDWKKKVTDFQKKFTKKNRDDVGHK